MNRKVLGEIIQEILEASMVVGMGESSAYNTGRIRGHQDAIDIVTKVIHSSVTKVKNDA